jgi:putative addiction module component (TIGR02574 family)
MAQMTPQVSELLEKALALSTQERGLLIDRLIETLDNEPAEEGVEAAWDAEIKRRVDDIRSGRVKTIPGEQVLRELAEEFPDGELTRRSNAALSRLCCGGGGPNSSRSKATTRATTKSNVKGNFKINIKGDGQSLP